MTKTIPRLERTAVRAFAERTAVTSRSVSLRWRSALFAFCTMGLLTACTTPGLDLSSTQIRQLQVSNESSLGVAAVPASATTEPSPYQIQAGDQLALRFFFNPEFDQEIRVQPDGAITVPLMGTRMVRDMSIPEVTEMVRAAYADELQQPQVVVQLIEATPRLVYVGGAVNRPAEIGFRHGLTPLEAILSAGGFDSSAKANEVIVIRKDRDGRPVPLVVDLEDAVMQADAAAVLRPWDIVFVPKDGVSKAGEWVDKYIRNLFLINGISFGYSLNPDDDDRR